MTITGKHIYNEAKDYVFITLGLLLYTVGWTFFLLPYEIVTGGVTGISAIIFYATNGSGHGIPIMYTYFIINAILLVLAYFLIGKEFGIKTCYTALILGPMMDLWEKICPNERLIAAGATSVMGELWFDLLWFVLILSMSQAIMFRINASTGGLDILAKIVNKYFHFDIGLSVTIAGVVICCTAFFVNPFRLVIIGLIGTWINGLIVDYFMASLSRRKRVCIISDEHEVIRDYIVNKIVRGCSLYEVTGGYKGEKRMEIQSLLTKDEFADLMKFLRDNKVQAFITAGNVSEVYGLWSDHKKHHAK